MAWRGALRAGVATGLTTLLVAAFPAAAGAQTTVAFTLADARITEASGMARDTAAGLYWTVQDSGAPGVVYGVGPDGKVRGTLGYRTTPRDAEAVAVQGNRLYVGDIGDNTRSRDMVTVYYFANPRASGLTVSYRAWDFRYADGKHDAETLLVTDAGRVYVVTKAEDAGIYRAPEKPSRTRVNTLTKVAPAPSGVTDGVVLPGGKQLALLTYTRVVVVDAATGQEQASTPLPALGQAESMTLSLDGTKLLVGSEGRRSKVYALPVPGADAGATPTPADPGGQDDPADDAAAPAPSRKGTLLAVGLAGLVAVVAGVVAGVARRPAERT